MIALFLTLLFPGLGHFYCGKNKKALILVGLSFIPFVYPFMLLYGLYDVFKLNKSGLVPVLSRREAITVILVSIAVPLAFLITIFFIGPKVYVSTMSAIKNVSNPKVNKQTMHDIANALERYYAHNKRYPGSLTALISDNPMRKKWLTDPWGNPYVYKTDRKKSSFKLISAGEDEERNTSDDIVISSMASGV